MFPDRHIVKRMPSPPSLFDRNLKQVKPLSAHVCKNKTSSRLRKREPGAGKDSVKDTDKETEAEKSFEK